MVKVLIIEDEPVIMQDIADYLETLGYVVYGKAYTAKKAFELLDNQIADLVLLDINLNDKIDGIEIGARIKNKYKIPFIYLTSYADQATLSRVKTTKPDGYIVKPFAEKDLYAAIELALFNRIPSKPKASVTLSKLKEQYQGRLTEKELEVLWGLYEGKTNKEISIDLFVSLNTIKTHVKKIYDKLDVHSRMDVMIMIRSL